MSFSNSFHKFLDAIGIVSRDEVEPDTRTYDRRGDYPGGSGRDFADEDSDYDDAQGARRDTSTDSYRGYSRTDSQYQSTPEIDNMVEFKNIRQRTETPVSSDHIQHTVIHYLREMSDCKDIIDDLLDDKQVILNVEDTDNSVKQRAIDTIYGASYALGAKLRRASRATYIIAPSSVVINDTDDEEEQRRPSGGYASNIRGFRS